MGDKPRDLHGLIPMLVAIRVAAARKKRLAAAAANGPDKDATVDSPKARRGWFR